MTWIEVLASMAVSGVLCGFFGAVVGRFWR